MSKPPATYQDVLDAPAGMRAELIDGVLYPQAAPAMPHQLVASLMNVDLGHRFHRRSGGDDPTRPGGWRIVAGPELWLGGSEPKALVVVPDLAGWRRERWDRAQRTHGQTVAPDWVCEVLSPTNHRYDRLVKADAYARGGVPFYWLVDPLEQLVEVYAARDGAWVRVAGAAGTDVARLPPFDAVELDVGGWWDEDEDEDDAPDAAPSP
jgi:Uma2 family endonuclease